MRRALAVAVALVALAACQPAERGRPGEPGPARVVAGNGTEGFADGTGDAARFRKPIRLAPLGEASVVVADIHNHAVREVRLDGRVLTIAGGPDRRGFRDGPAEDARLDSPHGVAVSPAGVIAVAEATSHTIRLLAPDRAAGPGTRYTVSTLAGAAGEEGDRDGPAGEARFRSPHAVAWDRDGSLVVPDIGNARVRRVREGRVETVAGAEAGTLTYPMDVAFAPDGTLLIADAGVHLVRTWTAADGLGTLEVAGALHTPHGVAAGPDGTVYVADMNAHRVVAIGRDGRVTRVAGTGEQGPAQGQLDRPADVLVHAGHLWVADLGNHRLVVVELR